MRIIQDNLWLCSDCTQVACNGPQGVVLDDERATLDGLKTLGPYLVPDFNSETGDGLSDFDNIRCDACRTVLAGYRARFAVLGD